MAKTFDLVIEGPPGGPNGDFLTMSPPALELTKLVWEGETPPNVILLEGGTALVKVARYAAHGDRYRYMVATMAFLVNGKLTATPAKG